MYTIGTGLFIILLIATHLIPAVTHATQQLQHTPTPEQIELVAGLQESNDVYLWTQETGFLLQYYGHRTIITENLYANDHSIEILQDLNNLETENSVRYIEKLSENSVNRVITPRETQASSRCFTQLYATQTYEVNKRECVIESRTA